MNKVRLLAACAALSLVAVACGDDDDDASGDTVAATDAAPTATAAAAATVAAPGTATPAGGTDDAATITAPPIPTLGGSDASDEVVADCQALGGVLMSAAQGGPDDPAVGEEISDEYKDFLQSVIDDLEDVDLETDEVEGAREAFVDFGNQVLDADTWSEELESGTDEALAPMQICETTLASAPAED